MSSATSDLPPYLRRFVLPYETVEPARSGEFRPPDWPAYRGYGALLAQADLVGGMFEHGFVDDKTLGAAQQNIRDAAKALLAHPRVDPDVWSRQFQLAISNTIGYARAILRQGEGSTRTSPS